MGATAGKRRNNKSTGSRKSRLKEPEECVEIDTVLQRKLLTTVILPGGVVAIEACCAVKQRRKDGRVKKGVKRGWTAGIRWIGERLAYSGFEHVKRQTLDEREEPAAGSQEITKPLNYRFVPLLQNSTEGEEWGKREHATRDSGWTLRERNMGKTKSLAQCRSFQISCNYGTWRSCREERQIQGNSTGSREIGSIAFSEFLFPVVAPSSVSFTLKLHVPREQSLGRVFTQRSWAFDYILYIDLFTEHIRLLCYRWYCRNYRYGLLTRRLSIRRCFVLSHYWIIFLFPFLFFSIFFLFLFL